ncbi:chemotaxis protein CheW [Halococcoides cellulosivorans]|uniref:Chemotaxis protein CheW n=1 Tax=Halococcoides cellulosivorans TaxID=1679096 RepID=A0A2R4WYS1_9EURY|nr:chemotaxis protein CheW [Halococcoides cellulosivorans]AWB26681.1 chemotaxis protein CheW [Halococcoides cellulosivorans]
MTDDDRMDRAERIKRMREGRRDDASSDDSTPEETAGDESSDDSPTGQDPTASERSPGPDPASGASDEDRPDAASDSPADEGIDSDAMAAAKRVAESVSGVDADTLAATNDAVESGAVDPTESDPETVVPTETDAGAAESSAETVAPTETVETRVLEFQLGDERYCIDIAYVEEIVKDEAITRVPNTPALVEGVVDLRGQITTILDPKEVIDVDDSETGSLIVVFDAEAVEDQGAIGWLVDEVHQVGPVSKSDLRDSPVEEAYINGVIDRDDQFVLWIEPDLALDAIDEE